MEAVIAVVLGLLFGVIFVLHFLIQNLRKKEKDEEVREKDQEKKLRLLDMFARYGFVVIHDSRTPKQHIGIAEHQHPQVIGCDGASGCNGATTGVYGTEKREMKVRIAFGTKQDYETDLVLLYDRSFESSLSGQEMKLYLKEYLLHLETMCFDWHGPWALALVKTSDTLNVSIVLRTDDELPKGGGLWL